MRILFAAIAVLAMAGANAEDERPNVILIMTDDQGYGDLGFTGNPVIRTPHLDTMAKGSARMENFYVCPVCAPTRACLMTGRYNYRTRAIDTYMGRAMMEPGEITVAEILRHAGYATGIFGKWHLGDNYPMRAMDQGFEESLVHRGGGIGQPSDPPGGEGKYTDPILFHNGAEIQEKGYCTDIYFDRGLAWIEKKHGEGKNFFAYFATNAPHRPLHDVPAGPLAAYKEMDLENSAFPQDQGNKLTGKMDPDERARIYAMITNVDDNVGKLFTKLRELGLEENTLVLFMADNGPNSHRYVAGLKGIKCQVHEGGIRSPFFAHWPARLKPGAGSDRVAAHIDLLPTVLDACGVAAPDGVALDGKSLLPLLTGSKDGWPDRTLFIQAHRGDAPVRYHHFAARDQQWKLVHPSGFNTDSFEGDPCFELYDMENDPFEMHDLAAEHPDRVKAMCQAYDAWFDAVSATRENNYAPPRIHIGTPHENPVVLTRQDWRMIPDYPFGSHANGFWELFVVRPGKYDFRLRFLGKAAARHVTLRMGNLILVQKLSKDAGNCTFESVYLNRGASRLQVDVKEGDKIIGPMMVDVIRQSSNN